MATPVEKDSMSEQGPIYPIQILIGSDPSEACLVQDQIEAALKSHQYCEKDIFSIKLALEEALVNAIKHGNRLDRSKKVRVAYRVEVGQFDVMIADEGAGFDPQEVPDPTAVENLERPCGRGLMLMRHYMTEVSYSPGGTTVHMRKISKNSAP